MQSRKYHLSTFAFQFNQLYCTIWIRYIHFLHLHTTKNDRLKILLISFANGSTADPPPAFE